MPRSWTRLKVRFRSLMWRISKNSLSPTMRARLSPRVYHGYERRNFVVDGCLAVVVLPKTSAEGRPWVWRAEFFDLWPKIDLALLAKGYHLVFMDVGNPFGSPSTVAHWNVLYDHMVNEYGLSRKPVLEGLSRGGLYVYNWAAANPDKVSCIYGDNPICDIKSCPGGRGKGYYGAGDWNDLMQAYGFKSDDEAMSYDRNPIDNATPLAAAKIPLINVCSDEDEIVPFDENSAILKERFEKLGGEMTLIMKHGARHHPHGLDDPAPVIEFILRNTTP